ncbi:MAG: ribose-phosphate pyrophosphokinase-like domain-containing protein [Desulfovibrionaceae bacterium]
MYIELSDELTILTGTLNLQLARDICSYFGCELRPLICDRFSDEEIQVEIVGNVRGSDVLLIAICTRCLCLERVRFCIKALYFFFYFTFSRVYILLILRMVIK